MSFMVIIFHSDFINRYRSSALYSYKSSIYKNNKAKEYHDITGAVHSVTPIGERLS